VEVEMEMEVSQRRFDSKWNGHFEGTGAGASALNWALGWPSRTSEGQSGRGVGGRAVAANSPQAANLQPATCSSHTNRSRWKTNRRPGKQVEKL